MSDILKNSDDPVIRFYANYNGGYLIQELFDAVEEYNVYWTSWRGSIRMIIPMLLFDFAFIGIIFFLRIIGLI